MDRKGKPEEAETEGREDGLGSGCRSGGDKGPDEDDGRGCEGAKRRDARQFLCSVRSERGQPGTHSGSTRRH